MLLFENAALCVYAVVVTCILGAVFGSFINCAAWRIAHGENFLRGRSHCADCGHPLSLTDLIPVVSYLALKGKCRYCGRKISPRYMLTELFMAAVCVLILLRYDLSFTALRYMGFAVILLGLSLVDLEIFEIPDGFIISGIVWWVLTVPLVSMDGAAVGEQLRRAVTGALPVAAFMLAISLVFDRILGRESLGGGDIKLFFLTGLYLGFANSLLQLILACFIGLLFAAALKKQKIPFGPSISAAAVLTLLIGPAIINWYLSLF